MARMMTTRPNAPPKVSITTRVTGRTGAPYISPANSRVAMPKAKPSASMTK
ncbi:hypothetical protein D3C75_1136180 [compost metagenome]